MQNLLTPPSLPGETVCRTLKIPSSKEWLGIFNALLLHASKSYNWEQVHDTDLTPDECAAKCYQIYEQWLGTGACPTDIEPPYWEDAQNVGDDNDDGIPWYDELGDWFLTGFLAVTFTPSAGIFYKTFVPKARVALRRGDWGALFKVLINGLEYTTGDSYSAITDILEIDLDIEGFAVANGLGAAPWDLQIKHNGTGATSDPNPRLEIVRKRLSEDEVTAITDIQQSGGQLQIQRGNIAVWENVPNADNLRRDGSTIMTGNLTLKSGSAVNGALNINPDSGQRAINIQLPVTAVTEVIRILDSNGLNIFSFYTNGLFSVRNDGAEMLRMMSVSGERTLIFATTAANTILTVRGRTSQLGNLQNWENASSVILASISKLGAAAFAESMTLRGATSIQQRDMARFRSFWGQSTDATRRAAFSISAYDFEGEHDLIGGGMAVDLGGNPYPILSFFGEAGSPQETITGIYPASSPFSQVLNALTALGLINNTSNARTPISVTGERQANAALASLLTALDTYGWITDDTTTGSAPSTFGSHTYELVPSGLSFAQITTDWDTITGEVYTLNVSGFITFDSAATAMDAVWNYTGVSWTEASPAFGSFKINGSAQNALKAFQTDHQYTFTVVGNGSPIVIRAENFGASPKAGSLVVAMSGNGVT